MQASFDCMKDSGININETSNVMLDYFTNYRNRYRLLLAKLNVATVILETTNHNILEKLPLELIMGEVDRELVPQSGYDLYFFNRGEAEPTIFNKGDPEKDLEKVLTQFGILTATKQKEKGTYIEEEKVSKRRIVYSGGIQESTDGKITPYHIISSIYSGLDEDNAQEGLSEIIDSYERTGFPTDTNTLSKQLGRLLEAITRVAEGKDYFVNVTDIYDAITIAEVRLLVMDKLFDALSEKIKHKKKIAIEEDSKKNNIILSISYF